MIISEFAVRDNEKMDEILVRLCELVVQGQQRDTDLGMVAAAVLDPMNNCVVGINYPTQDGHRVHAERAAIDSYTARFGPVPPGSTVITTCSPCNQDMEERSGESCEDFLELNRISSVYAGFQDPTQADSKLAMTVTSNPKIQALCQTFAETFLKDELKELSFLGSPCTKDCSGHRAGYEWTRSHPGRPAQSRSQSFNNGNALFLGGKE